MMHPFVPWAWRDEISLAHDPDRVTGTDRPEEEPGDANLVGYGVEAVDGGIGKVDEASLGVTASYLIVDTGPWIFGHKVLLPAGVVQRVDHAERKVHVDRTKGQIKDAPEYDKDSFDTDEYRERLGTYYTDSYRTGPPLP